MNRSHKPALVKAANSLSVELKSLDLPLRFKRSYEAERLEAIDGWWITLADWDGRPSVGICSDHCLGLGKPTVWTGFWAPTRRMQEIVDLNGSLPDELRSRTTLTDDDILQDRKWRLLKRPSRRSLRNSFMEHYESYDSYLGIYDEGGVDAFDVIRAAAFIQGVMRAVEPAMRLWKPSASPAKKAYIRYVKRFEVKISPLHDRLQTRFEEYLRNTGKEEIAPNLGGVDLCYRDFGDLVLCEVKPCTSDTVRFAIRTAIGQLLDYRQKFKEAHMQIVLSKRPASRDMDLALSNGFSIAFPSGRAFHVERAASFARI